MPRSRTVRARGGAPCMAACRLLTAALAAGLAATAWVLRSWRTIPRASSLCLRSTKASPAAAAAQPGAASQTLTTKSSATLRTRAAGCECLTAATGTARKACRRAMAWPHPGMRPRAAHRGAATAPCQRTNRGPL
eukprot:352285-Lingulodinium_polyedra.AAC.1